MSVMYWMKENKLMLNIDITKALLVGKGTAELTFASFQMPVYSLNSKFTGQETKVILLYKFLKIRAVYCGRATASVLNYQI